MDYYLSKASTRLGREPDNDVMVPGDLQVSRHHAEIRREGGHFVLYDLNSRNGTFVDGQRVPRATLADGNQIGIGRATLTYQNGALLLSGGAVVSSGPRAAPVGAPPPAWGAPAAPVQRDMTPYIVAAIAVLLVMAVAAFLLLRPTPAADEDLAEEIAETWVLASPDYLTLDTYNDLKVTNDLVPLPPATLRDEIYREAIDANNWIYDRPIKITEGVYNVEATLSFGITDTSTGITYNITDVFLLTVDTVTEQVKDVELRPATVS
jgi:hypothetical protein